MIDAPTEIQLHLITGESLYYFQSDPEVVTGICRDLDAHVFTRTGLIMDSAEEVTAVAGPALIGISILTNPLPPTFLNHERETGTMITQISPEAFRVRRNHGLTKVEGERNVTLAEIVFTSGAHLFLAIDEVAVGGMGERAVLQHHFTRPSLACRRKDGGFSIYNTAHIVSWSHFPKLEVPDITNSWRVQTLAEHQANPPKALCLTP